MRPHDVAAGRRRWGGPGELRRRLSPAAAEPCCRGPQAAREGAAPSRRRRRCPAIARGLRYQHLRHGGHRDARRPCDVRAGHDCPSSFRVRCVLPSRRTVGEGRFGGEDAYAPWAERHGRPDRDSDIGRGQRARAVAGCHLQLRIAWTRRPSGPAGRRSTPPSTRPAHPDTGDALAPRPLASPPPTWSPVATSCRPLPGQRTALGQAEEELSTSRSTRAMGGRPRFGARTGGLRPARPRQLGRRPLPGRGFPVRRPARRPRGRPRPRQRCS